MSDDAPFPQVNYTQIQRWRSHCTHSHEESCNDRYTELLSKQLSNLKFVDVIDGNLVTLPVTTPFVALSYVWGDVPVFKMTSSNIHLVQQPGSLLGMNPDVILPDTIRDAIHVVKELGQRYLWVDCLCVAQDADYGHMEAMLKAMARIYASAEFTIVAAAGENANHGLCGVGGSSRPRTLDDIPNDESDSYDGWPWESKWASRGWTFQEGLFSRRLLIFEGDVAWICGQCTWLEGDDQTEYMGDPDLWAPRPSEERAHLGLPMGLMSLLPRVPSFGRWGMLVENFSARSLTFATDHQKAFAGATEAMNHTFPGGIFHGLPEFFFDIALLWMHKQPEGINVGERAGFQRRGKDTPSWSWIGWHGAIQCLSAWYPFFAGVYRGSDDFRSWTALTPLKPVSRFWKVNPITKEYVPIRNKFYSFQTLRQQPDAPLPVGWHRHEHPRSDYFTYDKDPKNFNYAHPLPETDSTTTALNPQTSFSHILHCSGPIATLSLRPGFFYIESEIFAHLTDSSHAIVGSIFIHNHPDPDSLEPGVPCDLLALSEAVIQDPSRMDEHSTRHPQEWDARKDPELRFYNVMALSWTGGVAVRLGIGKVGKKAWDALGAEVRTFSLG
ncbi:HET-domain-containing protein [Polyplosphaeria fusca]|uniref:HET-domain-containing protein n=1 Tax=Polyplosphaeria fusca TaxID=682080 RepID=A0A9P4RAT8_9PLEO|nr:HET-domain-containing protein [Polyplosphaeria fusca]